MFRTHSSYAQRKNVGFGVSLLLAASSVVIPQQCLSADAVGELEEIVVTAQRREESLQRVPISVTALSSDQLEQRQVRSPSDLVGSVPNLQFNEANGGSVPIFSLRGISMSDFSFAQNAPIATYYDEVYKGNLTLLGLQMFDLERVEVLKGPQGTLYGKNTTGGAINLISRRPSFSTEAQASIGYGNYNHFQADGALQTALSDSLAARFAFTYEEADGWQKNLAPDAPDLNSTDQYGFRGSLLFQPSEAFETILRLSHSVQTPLNYGTSPIAGPNGVGNGIYELFGGHSYFPPGDLGRWEVNVPEAYEREHRTSAASLTMTVHPRSDLTITSITAYDYGDLLHHEASDGSPPKTTDSTYYGETRQLSQDIRLTSHRDARFNYVAGVYFTEERIFNYTNLNFFADIDIDCLEGGLFLNCQYGNRFHQEKTSVALYADANFALSDRVLLRAGLRDTDDRGELRDFVAQARTISGVPLVNTIPGDPDDVNATTSRRFSNNKVSYKVGVDFDLTPNALLYLSNSSGYRGSAFSAQAFFGPPELTVVKPETVNATEIGLKSEWYDRKLRLNAAAYYYLYENQQFIDVDPITTLSPLVNLPKSRIIGTELEIAVRPVTSLTWSLGLGALKSKILEGTSYGMNVAGNDLIQAPSLTAATAIDWSIDAGSLAVVDLHIDANYASKQYYDILNRPSTTLGDRTLLNARVRAHTTDDRFGVALWAKNITNEFYYTTMIDASGIGFTYTHVNAPRMYGITFDTRF